MTSSGMWLATLAGAMMVIGGCTFTTDRAASEPRPPPQCGCAPATLENTPMCDENGKRPWPRGPCECGCYHAWFKDGTICQNDCRVVATSEQLLMIGEGEYIWTDEARRLGCELTCCDFADPAACIRACRAAQPVPCFSQLEALTLCDPALNGCEPTEACADVFDAAAACVTEHLDVSGPSPDGGPSDGGVPADGG